MRIDPAVSAAKFKAAVATLAQQTAVLREWGCFVAATTFPFIDVICVPKSKLRLSAPVQQQLSTLVLPAMSVQLATVELPMLAARSFGVRIALDDFDQRAPSLTFHDPFTWEPLKFLEMFRALSVDATGKILQVLLGDHPATKLPFLCMRGIREYHEHPQHTGDDWMLYRGNLGVFTIVATVHRTCLELAPNVILQPNLLQVNWEIIPKRG